MSADGRHGPTADVKNLARRGGVSCRLGVGGGRKARWWCRAEGIQ